MGERAARLRAIWRGASRVGKALLSVMYLVLAVFALVIVLVELPGSMRAARNEGVPGTFTAVRKACSPPGRGGGGCSSFGDFVSRDGTIRLTDVVYEGDPGNVGDSVPAQYVGGVDPVIINEFDSKEWMYLVAIGIGAAGYLAYRGWRLIRTLRSRRFLRR